MTNHNDHHRRRFNGQERAALYLASGGNCAACGTPLLPGWHADHKHAYARGGITDVVNGQALCPTCNMKKGSKGEVGMAQHSESRPWQIAAWRHYEAVNKQDFLCCACPGAGKTRWALALARRLLDNGTVRRVVIVAPSRSVRDQWTEQTQVHLEAIPNEQGGHENYHDFEGCALTYAQVATQPDLQRMAVAEHETLVIFDEIHHAGEEQSWGDKMMYAFEYAARRVGLTGTPWRRPKMGRIPFVTYDDSGRILPDYEYSYGKATADTPPVCRVIQFHAYDTQLQCVELELGTSMKMALSDLTDAQDRSQAMTAILDTKREWMRSMIEKAHAELLRIRKGSADDDAVSDAQGLVIADTQDHAREVKRLLEQITGAAPELIISDEHDAELALDRFRRGSTIWAVAVNKISEGVDVVPLYVGVYATRKTSPLLFRQIAGRFVRRRSDETRDAVLFIPAVPDLVHLASEIESEMRHAAELALDDEQTERKKLEREPLSGSPILEVWETSQILPPSFIRSGEIYGIDEAQRAVALSNQLKLSGQYVDPIIVAKILRLHDADHAPSAAPSSPHHADTTSREPISKTRQKQLLRAKVDTMAKRVAYKTGTEPKVMNDHLARRFGPRSSLRIEQLNAVLVYLEGLEQKAEEAI